jgi:hypothetical protein
MLKKQMLLITVFGIFQLCSGTGLLLGDRTTTADGDSFSFALNPKSWFDLTNEYFYVSSSEALAGEARPYALAGTTLGAKTNQAGGFVPFAPEKVTLNGTAGTANPLYGADIVQMGMVGSQPVAVKADSLNTLYWITSKLSSTTQTMVSNTTVLKDANAANANGVIVFANTVGTALTGAGNTLFVAVKPAGGNFGFNDNSGIAVLTKTDSGLTQEKAVHGDDTTVKAVKFDKTIAELNMGAQNITTLAANVIDLYWDSSLCRLYIGTSIDETAGNGIGGARSVVIGYVHDQGVNGKKLRLTPIAPTAAFTADNIREIVGLKRHERKLHTYRNHVMHTSTGLSYLIVHGSSSDPENNLCDIFALPLVDESANPANTNWKTSTTHGTLAKKNTTPTDYYLTASNGIEYFYKRGFQTPATVAGDLFTDQDVAAKVGRAAVPGAIISSMQVYKDAVFVSTSAGAVPEDIGIFYSQALFDANGVIVNWTAWQRVYYGTDSIKAFAFSPTKGQLFTLEGDDTDRVKRTEWSDGANDGILGGTAANASLGFIEKVSTQFPQEQGGIMGLFDFDKTYPFFNQRDNAKLSLMVATGYKKIAIIKTGTDTAGTLNPTIGNFSINQRTFTAGALDANSIEGGAITNTTDIITVSGGVLNDLGAITSAAITGAVDADNKGYLVVGGTGGVAVLRTAAFEGWQAHDVGLTKDLATDLGTTRYFQKIGNFTNVKKMWNAVTTANPYVLYVLTDKALYRIDSSTLGQANPTITLIATIAGLGLPSYASFSDFVASKRLGLLATSHGLYRTGNGNNISTAANETAVGWTSVTLPTSYTSIVKLLPLSKSALPYQFADGAPGQVYYIAGKVGSHASALGCLAINDASADVGATTVQAVVNPATKAIDGTVNHAPLAFLGNYRNCFVTNGGSFLVTSPQQLTTAPKLMRLPLSNGIGYGFNYLQEKEIELSALQDAGTINGVERNSATGSWLVYGDFGLQVLE